MKKRDIGAKKQGQTSARDFWYKMTAAGKIKPAFLLAAGLGTRLKPLTDTLPKPLLPLGGKPVIIYAMERLAAIGVKRFIINTHHLPQEYARAFPQNEWRSLPIIFSHEETLLDTAGGLKNIEPLLEDDENIFIHNADILCDAPMKKLIEAHLAGNALATLALRSTGNLLNIVISPEGYILDVRSALGVKTDKCYQFSGIYIARRELLNYIPPQKVESIADTLIRLIAEKPYSVGGLVIDEGS